MSTTRLAASPRTFALLFVLALVPRVAPAAEITLQLGEVTTPAPSYEHLIPVDRVSFEALRSEGGGPVFDGLVIVRRTDAASPILLAYEAHGTRFADATVEIAEPGGVQPVATVRLARVEVVSYSFDADAEDGARERVVLAFEGITLQHAISPPLGWQAPASAP